VYLKGKLYSHIYNSNHPIQTQGYMVEGINLLMGRS